MKVVLVQLVLNCDRIPKFRSRKICSWFFSNRTYPRSTTLEKVCVMIQAKQSLDCKFCATNARCSGAKYHLRVLCTQSFANKFFIASSHDYGDAVVKLHTCCDSLWARSVHWGLSM